MQDLHGRRTSLCGMTFAGFEGCVRYGGGGAVPLHAEGGDQARHAGCPPPTCCSATARRAGSTTTRRTPRTSASRACSSGSAGTAPRHLLHGHTHPLGGRVMQRFEDTRVHWISGARMVLLD